MHKSYRQLSIFSDIVCNNTGITRQQPNINPSDSQQAHDVIGSLLVIKSIFTWDHHPVI
jgi:hypothetical protein